MVMGLTLSSRMGLSSASKPRRICISPSSGTRRRTSSSKAMAPRSTSIMMQVAVMILVMEAIQVKDSVVNSGESGLRPVRPAEAEQVIPGRTHDIRYLWCAGSGT